MKNLIRIFLIVVIVGDVYKRQDKGDVKLEEKTAYKSATDDELIMLEMSKREKKKFKKQKYSK